MVMSHLPLLAMNIQGAYCLKSAGHHDIESYREVVLSLFKDSVSLNKQQVEQACLKTLGKSLPNNIYEKIMKEVAYRPHGQPKWIFKTGKQTEGS